MTNEAVPTAPVASDQIPDLLHATPLRRVALESTELAMVLAFAGGTSGGLFSDALGRASFAPSTWEPQGFASDLFVDRFIATCFRAKVDGAEPVLLTRHLSAVLSTPPADAATVEFRRGIVAELMGTPARRAALQRLYARLCRFRGQLEGSAGAGRWDANRRQLDVLASLRDVFDTLDEGFVESQSGLRRLHGFGARVRRSEGYQSLAHLLAFDERLATLSFKIDIGADGRVRRLELETLAENGENPFVSSPWRRWLARLELFARGYSLREGEVMARLLDAVFEGVRGELVALVQLLGDVEFYLGALGFKERAEEAGLSVSLPVLGPPEEARELQGLFNPLLLGHGVKPVPCDIRCDRHDTTLLITGPNSGGKTRLLQSLGLAQLLAQGGLFVPARSARMSLTTGLVVSLIQETHADQAEGRLGTELVRIRSLFERLPPGAMVILDELCSGTNPSEGEEIFELVIRMLTRLRPQAFITTHFLGIAARLQHEQKIGELRFLQVELGRDDEPTYQFKPGVAETSLAAHAAARLGVTGEQLLGLIEQKIKSRAGG